MPEQLTAFGGGFASIKKTKKIIEKKTALKCSSESSYERTRTLLAKMRRSPAIFSVYEPSDYAISDRNLTPGP